MTITGCLEITCGAKRYARPAPLRHREVLGRRLTILYKICAFYFRRSKKARK
jgi:hypothetical protein